MSELLTGACVIGQSGGPTSVINASAYGVIRTALDSPSITRVLGAANGIRGILDDVLYDMGEEDRDQLDLMLQTPSSALGSCRYKLKPPEEDPSDYQRILEIFQKYNVRYFFYNGGNDSMDTCNKISKYLAAHDYECRVIGVPKTIDNDLWGTDHCPGYASAAKYIATSCMELYHDARVYDTGMICVLEIMGRHAGWLAAAASIASYFGQGPDLIYVPERVFDMDRFIADVKAVYERQGKCIAAVSEGIRDKDGKLIAEYGSHFVPTDAFGHKQLGGLASNLAQLVNIHTGAKVRGIEFSLLQRCASHCASETDVQEAFMSGKVAVECAVSGITDKMIAFTRSAFPDGSYRCGVKLLDLADVANREKKLPDEWINEAGNGITEDFMEYILPLIQGEPVLKTVNGLPQFCSLKKIRAR